MACAIRPAVGDPVGWGGEHRADRRHDRSGQQRSVRTHDRLLNRRHGPPPPCSVPTIRGRLPLTCNGTPEGRPKALRSKQLRNFTPTIESGLLVSTTTLDSIVLGNFASSDRYSPFFELPSLRSFCMSGRTFVNLRDDVRPVRLALLRKPAGRSDCAAARSSPALRRRWSAGLSCHRSRLGSFLAARSLAPS